MHKLRFNTQTALEFSIPLDVWPSLAKLGSSTLKRVPRFKPTFAACEPWEQRIVLRAERPPFNLPSVFDLLPPPPPTLHWRTPPQPGEYGKVRKIVASCGVHIWLIANRMRKDAPADCEKLWEVLWVLAEKWIVDASVPRLGSSGEVRHFKELVGGLSQVLTEAFESESSDLTMEERVGAVQYLLTLVFDESQASLRTNSMSDLTAFTFAQHAYFSEMTSNTLLKGEWNWLVD